MFSPSAGQRVPWARSGAAAAAWAHYRRRCSGTGPLFPHRCLASRAQELPVRCARRDSPPCGYGDQSRIPTTRPWNLPFVAPGAAKWWSNCVEKRTGEAGLRNLGRLFVVVVVDVVFAGRHSRSPSLPPHVVCWTGTSHLVIPDLLGRIAAAHRRNRRGSASFDCASRE